MRFLSKKDGVLLLVILAFIYQKHLCAVVAEHFSVIFLD